MEHGKFTGMHCAERIAVDSPIGLAYDECFGLEQEMPATDFTPLASLAGGAMIGASAVLLLLVSGRIAGGLAPGTPLTHGALAALISFGGWLIVRVTIPLVFGNDVGFGGRAIVTNAMFATAFGVLGGALSMRDARV